MEIICYSIVVDSEEITERFVDGCKYSQSGEVFLFKDMMLFDCFVDKQDYLFLFLLFKSMNRRFSVCLLFFFALVVLLVLSLSLQAKRKEKEICTCDK